MKHTEINSIASINEWFNRARPVPTKQDFNVQFGVHLEEIVESLITISASTQEMEDLLNVATAHLSLLADILKDGRGFVEINNPVLFADAMADTIVTAVGSMHDAGMQAVEIVKEVDKSNWSKFGLDGQPSFKPNGKIAKDLVTYAPPDLNNFV